MWIVVIILIALVVFWIIAMNVDERIFRGRFLVRAKAHPEKFKKTLEGVISQKDRPFTDWDLIPGDWIDDKMNIPLQDRRLDEMRQDIVKAIEGCREKDRLSPAAIDLIEQAIRKI